MTAAERCPIAGDPYWPHDDGSIDEAAYEVLYSAVPEYRKQWIDTLLERVRKENPPDRVAALKLAGNALAEAIEKWNGESIPVAAALAAWRKAGGA